MDDDDFDFSGFESTGTEDSGETATVESTEEAAPTVNPAWNEYLEKIPESLRPMVTPAFQAWDQGVSQRFSELNQKWEPYREFQEQQIGRDALQQAYTLAQQVQQDPVGIYTRLHEILSQDPRYAQQLIQAGLIPDPNKAAEVTEETPSRDPLAEIDRLQQQLRERDEEMLNSLRQQEEQQRFNEVYEKTQNDIAEGFTRIETAIGKPIPNPVRAEIIKHAQYMGGQSGKYVSVEEAAPYVFQFMQQARAGAKGAPRTIGGGGAAAPLQIDPATATPEQRVALAQEIARRLS